MKNPGLRLLSAFVLVTILISTLTTIAQAKDPEYTVTNQVTWGQTTVTTGWGQHCSGCPVAYFRRVQSGQQYSRVDYTIVNP